MKNIIVLIPDNIDKPMGGMGEQCRQIVNVFDSDYYFDIIGSLTQDLSQGRNYSFYPVMNVPAMIGLSDPICDSFLHQALYVEKALSLKVKPDIVHAYDWSTFFAGRILAQHFNVPLVITIQLGISKFINPRTVGDFQRIPYDIACSIEYSGMIEADRVIQVSSSYAKSYPSIFLPKTTVIENGINISDWKQTEKISLPGDRRIKLIYIGRFAEMKNVVSLLHAKIPEDIDLIFIGSNRGGQPEIFDYMINEVKNRDNLHYVGAKYGQDKINYLMSADAVIVPSTHEPFGIVALETLASRSILLSSFVDGMGDYLTDSCAINCGTSKESISNALNKLVSMSDLSKKSLIENGLELCKNYDWKIQATKLKNLYENLI